MTRKQYLKKKRKSTPRRRGWLIPVIIVLAVLLCAGIGLFAWWMLRNRPAPEDTVRNYFSLLSEKKSRATRISMKGLKPRIFRSLFRKRIPVLRKPQRLSHTARQWIPLPEPSPLTIR